MSKLITGRTPNFGKSVSHAHNRKSKKQKLNKQYFTINGMRMLTTAREAKAMRKLFNK